MANIHYASSSPQCHDHMLHIPVGLAWRQRGRWVGESDSLVPTHKMRGEELGTKLPTRRALETSDDGGRRWWKMTHPPFFTTGTGNNGYRQSQALSQVLHMPRLWVSNPPSATHSPTSGPLPGLLLWLGVFFLQMPAWLIPPVPQASDCHLLVEAFPDCPPQNSTLPHHSLRLLSSFIARHVNICSLSTSFLQS